MRLWMAQLSAGKVTAMANQPTLYELSFWKRHSRYLRDVQPAGATLNSTITTSFRPRTSPVMRSRPPIPCSAGWSRCSSPRPSTAARPLSRAGSERELAAVESRQHHNRRHRDAAQIRDRQTAAGTDRALYRRQARRHGKVCRILGQPDPAAGACRGTIRPWHNGPRPSSRKLICTRFQLSGRRLAWATFG